MKPRQPRPSRDDSIPIKSLYTSEDLAGVDHLDALPGFVPYARGIHATMYTTRPWTVRQYAGFSTAEDSNAFFRNSLAAGQAGLSVAFDLPTHRGYDSDHHRVSGDVGKAGVAIDSVEDMKRLFAEIPLDRVSVSMTMSGAVLPIMAMYIVTAEEQGYDLGNLTGTLQNDILKEFLVRNAFIYPPEPSMRIVADIIQYASKHLPRFNPISISGYHMQEAGASATQELALTLANGLEYVRSARDAGLEVDDFAPRLSFFFGVGMDFFAEIAKLRAARLLWAELMTDHFQPKNPRSLMLRTHCQTSGVSLTSHDPLNNIVRTTIEGLAAVLGGTQSLHTNAYDEALALPSDRSARIARNTQHILREETGVTETVDPLAGSFFLESLTKSMVDAARSIILEVESLGGMLRAINVGAPQQWIERSSAMRQARLDRGEEVVVGVNRFTTTDEAADIEVRDIDLDSVRTTQLARLAEVRRSRDPDGVADALRRLESAARSAENLLEATLAAVRARATLGEVSEVLEQVFGRHQPATRLSSGAYGSGFPQASEFATLRSEVAEFASRTGRRPRLLVAKLGQDGHDRGAKVIATGFADLGYDVELGPLFATPHEVAHHAIDSDVHVVGVSTHAAGHRALVPILVDELKAARRDDVIVVCGGIIPSVDREALRAIGVSAFFGPGTSVVDAARDVLALVSARHGLP